VNTQKLLRLKRGPQVVRVVEVSVDWIATLSPACLACLPVGKVGRLAMTDSVFSADPSHSG